MSRRATRKNGRALLVRDIPTGVPDDQLWFWTEAWQRGERQASRDIRKGFVTTCRDGDDLPRMLLGPPFQPWKRAR